MCRMSCVIADGKIEVLDAVTASCEGSQEVVWVASGALA